ncbi:MAG TPA: hypothetical protein VF707_11045, partial [Ardenticatenaceae bacterium]
MTSKRSDEELLVAILESLGTIAWEGDFDPNGNLISLDLSGNALAALPPTISQFNQLQRLSLDGNQLA